MNPNSTHRLVFLPSDRIVSGLLLISQLCLPTFSCHRLQQAIVLHLFIDSSYRCTSHKMRGVSRDGVERVNDEKNIAIFYLIKGIDFLSGHRRITLDDKVVLQNSGRKTYRLITY
jgi:hypothetical protein